MKLATLHLAGETVAAVQKVNDWIVIDGYADLGALLKVDNWRQIAQAANGQVVTEAEAHFGQLISEPGKIVCVGLNYAAHIEEMGRELPTHPTLFAKYTETLTGPFDDVVAVEEDPDLDWEGELVVVVGERAHRVAEADAGHKIAGYAMANDISMRGWQFRTIEWLQGKIWEASTPVGPYMVMADEFDYTASTLRTKVNGQIMQEHSIDDLVFTPEYLVSYISTMLPLNPGDIILTGTPGGVGRAREPQVFLKAGDEVEVSIDGIGSIRSQIVEP